MDQKLLQALNNVGLALESLVDALESKKEASSSTAKAMQSGNFGKQLEVITTKISEIKSDTEKILKNQETIIAISKEKESDKKTKDIEEAGGEKKKAGIKEGVGAILLIAVAVLAIGFAFKLVGDVNVLSVIALAIAITIIATAFEKVANMGLTIKDAAIASLTLVMISVALTLSSIALSFIQPISLVQFFSSILIAAVFAVVSFGIKNMLNAFKGIEPAELLSSVIFLPLILPAIALGLALASHAFKLIQPIGLAQFFSAVMVGLVFVVLSFGLKKIIGVFQVLDSAKAVIASFMIPIVFTAMSIAIWKSSELLSQVVPIGLAQFITSIAISLVFVVLAFTLAPIIKLSENLKWSSVVKLPALFTLMSLSIMISSHILAMMAPLSFQQMLQAAILGVTLGIISLIMTPAIKVLGKLEIDELIKGGLAIVLIAGIVMVSSHILAAGDYGNYPGIGWIIGVALSLTTFGIAAFALGAMVFGPQALIFLAGIGAVLTVAGTIVGVSKILAAGDYEVPGLLKWAVSTALLYATFTPIMLILGTAALASAVISIFGPDPWKLAQKAMVYVAQTIVDVSFVLQKGSYKGGPTKEWADGVGMAISAFAPVFEVLTNQSWLGKSVSAEDMRKAILTISEGIVDAAKFFGNPEILALFNTEGKYPTEEWSKGVGSSLKAFAPVFEALSGKSWYQSGDDVIDNMSKGIRVITSSIVSSAKAFSGYIYDEETGKWTESGFGGVWSTYPTKEWSNGISTAIKSYLILFEVIKNKGYTLKQFVEYSNVLRHGLSSMSSTAKNLFLNKEYFGLQIDPNYMKNVSQNIIDFNNLVKQLVESEGDKGMLEKLGDTTSSLLGTDPISQIARRMITLADGYDKLAQSLTKLGVAMKTLNITDVKALGGLTRQLVSPDGVENKQPGQIENKTTTTSVKVSTGNVPGFTREGTLGDKKTSQQLDHIIKLLTNIDKSSESLDTLISQQIGEEDPKKETNTFGYFWK